MLCHRPVAAVADSDLHNNPTTTCDVRNTLALLTRAGSEPACRCLPTLMAAFPAPLFCWFILLLFTAMVYILLVRSFIPNAYWWTDGGQLLAFMVWLHDYADNYCCC